MAETRAPIVVFAGQVECLMSGGQTGVDRAVLDFALGHNILHRGWCPAGRKASDGPLAARYQLQETESAGWSQRTLFNVRDSDATLIMTRGPLVGGSLLTQKFTRRLQKPAFILELPQGGGEVPDDAALGSLLIWLRELNVKVLNVAGPGEERVPGVHAQAMATMERLDNPVGRLVTSS